MSAGDLIAEVERLRKLTDDAAVLIREYKRITARQDGALRKIAAYHGDDVGQEVRTMRLFAQTTLDALDAGLR